MENEEPKKPLSEYLDAAAAEPIRIIRKDGSSFILVSEEVFTSMQEEILSLERRIRGLCDVIGKKTTPYDPNEDRLARFRDPKPKN